MAIRSTRAAVAVACVAVLGLTACGAQSGVAGDPAQPLPGSGPGDGASAAPGASAHADESASGSATAEAAGSGVVTARVTDDAGGSEAAASGTGGGTGDSGGTGSSDAALPPHSARAPDGRQTAEPRAADDPIGVTLPSIGVQSRLVRLGLDARREMEVPDDFSLAGWYVHGPKPGAVGPAVIAGHVDGRRGPAVFYRLHELAPGDRVEIHRADGSSVLYAVDRVEQHPKNAFPTEAVYGNTQGPELRLITCGGEFDRRARSHRDNIIVFAHIVEG
jgi:hypothetical protein